MKTPAQVSQQELTEKEQTLANQRQQLQEQEEQLRQQREQMAAADRQDKLEQRSGLLDDAADWREMARAAADAEKGKDYLRRAKDAEAQAAQLGIELNLVDATTVELATKPEPKPISTGNAIWLIVGLFLAFLAATYFVGMPIAKDPMNAIGQSMLVNAPLRGLLAFTLTFATFLVSVFFIYFCFPDFFRIWHNRVDSERSLKSLINESPAWAVLLFLLGLFFTFMQVFASYYQALYA